MFLNYNFLNSQKLILGSSQLIFLFKNNNLFPIGLHYKRKHSDIFCTTALQCYFYWLKLYIYLYAIIYHESTDITSSNVHNNHNLIIIPKFRLI